ncbi:hypothetical protein PV797_01400 [Clostridiaceae bacterium M8S5]|nr:hypothetical protein PV797_01400 [Clostridiaceae bacterium M8S5]
MEFKEFGKRNQKRALLIHGGYVSWKTLYVQIEQLSSDYHVYVPLLDGHNMNNDSELKSIELEALKIIKYFEDKEIHEIDVIYGASLGGDIVLEIMCQSNNFAKFAFVESGALNINNIMGWLLTKLTTKVIYNSVRGNKICEKVLDKWLEHMKMPKHLHSDTKRVLKHMSKYTTKNVQNLVCNYKLKESMRGVSTKCLIVYTSKEKGYMKRPYSEMKKMVKNMQIMCIEGYVHGELCIGNPKKVVKMMRDFISKNTIKKQERGASLESE